jgi:hypothetical protein
MASGRSFSKSPNGSAAIWIDGVFAADGEGSELAWQEIARTFFETGD